MRLAELVCRLADAPERIGRLASALTALAANRVELFKLELELEKRRVVRLVVVAAVATGLAVVTLVLGLLAIFLAIDPAMRMTALLWTLAGFGAATAAAVIGLWLRIKNAPPPFELFWNELKKDRELL